MKPVRTIFMLIIFPLVLCGQGLNYNYSHLDYGHNLSFADARHLSLGGSGLAGGNAVAAFAANPALLRGAGLQAGMSLQRVDEDRAYPYYDTFVGFTDYGSYTYSSNWYASAGFTAWYQFSIGGLPQFSVGTGVLPVVDFNYDYLEEVRDPNDRQDRLIGYNRISQSGYIYSVPVVLAVRPLPRLSLGLQADVLFGSLEYRSGITPQNTALAAIEQKSEIDKSLNARPVRGSLGLTYRVNDRLIVAAAAHMPYTLKFKFDTAVSRSDTAWSERPLRTLEYPLKVGAGLDYRFTNILQARLSLDFSYQFWSRFRDSFQDELSFNDTWTISAGIEHQFLKQIPLRAGFLFETLRESKSFTRSVLTIGSGFSFKKLLFTVGGGFESLQYYQDDPFPDSIYNLNDRTDKDRVRLNQFYARLDVTYQFGE